jgi:hypothetical protein
MMYRVRIDPVADTRFFARGEVTNGHWAGCRRPDRKSGHDPGFTPGVRFGVSRSVAE